MMMKGGWWLVVLTACGAAAEPARTPTPTPTTSAPGPLVSASDSHAEHQAAAAPAQRQPDDSLLGVIDQPAAPWQVSQWFNSPPLSLEQLRGKVVLVRWFTSPSCPFCSATAPTLRALHERYATKGLAVIGMYHHKDDTPLDP